MSSIIKMNNTTTSDYQWCTTSLDAFHTVYHNIHGFVSLFVCIFGSIANSLNIAVLTRRDMRSPTNAILTGLAVADLLVMLDYIPYSLNEYLFRQFAVSRQQQRSYAWAVIIYFHAFFSQSCHTISIFLTVTLAVWRYIAIAHPQKNRLWCNMRTTMLAILSTYLICPLLCALTFCVFRIVPLVELHDTRGVKVRANETAVEGARNVTLFILGYSDYIEEYRWIWPTYFWVFSAFIKIVPSVALTVLSLRLVAALVEAKRRRQQLMEKQSRVVDKERQTDRTTRMLLAVLVLFLVTEIPQGVLALLSASSQTFYHHCYLKLGEVMDILALLNSAINFILYCTMSRQFRRTFKLMFLTRWLPVVVAQHELDGIGCEMRQTTTVTQV